MSVLIKGAKPPSGCGWCYFNTYGICALIVGCDYDYTNGTQRRKDCPLIELPDHGDLIDRDNLIYELGEEDEDLSTYHTLLYAPVVIPAERSDEWEFTSKT